MNFIWDLITAVLPRVIPDPKVGEKWEAAWEHNPFRERGKTVAEVLDVKEGWVKYRWTWQRPDDKSFETNRIQHFKSAYRRPLEK